MVRSALSARGPRGAGSALVWTLLLAVLVPLLGPSAPGEAHPRTWGAAASVPTARGETFADSADPAGSAAAVRNQRDATGERHAPPLSAPGTSPDPGTGPSHRARASVAAVQPPASLRPAHRHGVRAPPAPSGT
ncbi:hypothetical protein [Streptomyces sp. NPDC046939]|uniref:hypothetical protein n=1 Tax=Streptomyces sp. NPDC046939 TaxID=3155376 RepID=UPI0033EB244D